MQKEYFLRLPIIPNCNLVCIPLKKKNNNKILVFYSQVALSCLYIICVHFENLKRFCSPSNQIVRESEKNIFCTHFKQLENIFHVDWRQEFHTKDIHGAIRLPLLIIYSTKTHKYTII